MSIVAPVLTETVTPGPAVEVLWASLDPDIVRVTVYRVADGERVPVRGAVRSDVLSAFVVTDAEVPFGVESQYVGEFTWDDGTVELSAPQSITVNSDSTWIQPQYDPTIAVEVNFLSTNKSQLWGDSFNQLPQNRVSNTMYVLGQRRPYVQDFGLKAIENAPFSVRTDTVSQYKDLLLVLQQSPLLVRTPPAKFPFLPRNFSAIVRSPVPDALDQPHGGTTVVWTLTADEVQPLNPAIIRPLVTWQDWMDAFPENDFTWGDVMAVYSAGTWLDAVRNPPV